MPAPYPTKPAPGLLKLREILAGYGVPESTWATPGYQYGSGDVANEGINILSGVNMDTGEMDPWARVGSILTGPKGKANAQKILENLQFFNEKAPAGLAENALRFASSLHPTLARAIRKHGKLDVIPAPLLKTDVIRPASFDPKTRTWSPQEHRVELQPTLAEGDFDRSTLEGSIYQKPDVHIESYFGPIGDQYKDRIAAYRGRLNEINEPGEISTIKHGKTGELHEVQDISPKWLDDEWEPGVNIYKHLRNRWRQFAEHVMPSPEYNPPFDIEELIGIPKEKRIPGKNKF
jgi:hypothetical protein